jgi:YYY domain-containing protein
MEYGLAALWLVAFLAVGGLALPVAGALLGRTADRGAAVAVPIGLAAIGIVAFLVGHLRFGWVAPLAGVAALAGLAVAAGRTGTALPDRRTLAETAAVFAGAFALLVAVRAVDPAVAPLPLSIGEKFLDFGLLNAVLRADRLPPEDMWFAGEPVRYYYGGHLLVGILARLTGTAPRFAYNLGLAGFYAAFVTAAYGLAGNVTSAAGGPRRLGAAFGAFFVALAGNLYVTVRVVAWLLPDGLAAGVAGAVGGGEAVLAWTPADFFYFSSSRVIPGTINEFPLFAWLNGDLHAHMLSTPFLLLVAALLFAYWETPARAVGRRRLLLFGALPPVAGLIAVVNTWSFPSAAFGLVVVTLAIAPARPADLLPAAVGDAFPRLVDVREEWSARAEAGRIAAAVAVGIVTLALAVAWSFPFWLGTASGRSIGVLPERSGLVDLLIVHGPFLALLGAYFLRRTAGALERPALVLAAVGVGAGAAITADAAAVALFGPLLLAGWALARARRDVGFEVALAVGAAGLALLVEFLFVVERAGPGRFNTVFKTYAQVWALFAPAAGVALARLIDGSLVPSPRAATWRRAGVALAVVAVLSTGTYAALALPAHFGTDRGAVTAANPSLDGLAYVEERHPGEARAIAWLDARPGTPAMLSAPGCGRYDDANCTRMYYWSNAPSSLTGVPTVAGWNHEVGYRGAEVYMHRVGDVTAMFTGEPATQRRLLDRYGVEYVYVGPNERSTYGNRMTVTDLEAVSPVHRSGDVVVYRVDRGAL